MKRKNNMSMRTNYSGFGMAAIMLFLFSVPVLAQQKKDTKLESENVDIVRDYKPKILDAAKIEVLPEPEKLEVRKPEMKYFTTNSLFPTQPYKTPFRTLQISKGEQEPLQHAYVKAALGNYNNIYAEGFVNTLYNKKGMFAAQARYHSGDGPVSNSQFSNAFVDLNGKKMFGKNIVTGDFNYRNEMYHFYGYNHDSFKDINSSKIKQVFNDVNISGGFEHAMADTGQLKYKLGFSFYNFQDNFKVQENDLTITGRAIEPFHQNSIVFDASFDYMGYKLIKDYSRNIVKIDVNYKFELDGLRGYAGFKTANESDSSASPFHFYPNLQVEGDLSGKYLVGFMGITGGLKRNTFKSFAYENPFVESGLDLRNTNNKLNVFGGIKGSIGSNGFYLLSLSYELYKNLYFYAIDTSNRFVTLYDDNTKVLHIHAEGGLALNSKFDLTGVLNYYNYNLSSPILQKPFHRPGLELGIEGKYTIENKIVLGADIYAMDKRYALLSINGKDMTTLSPVFDVNLNATYKHSNTLAFYVELNNLLNQKYQLWNSYPVRGLQVLAGVKINFW